MDSKTDNRWAAGVVLGGIAAGAGIGAVANNECSRSNSSYVGAVRGAEAVALAGLVTAALSEKHRTVGLIAAATGGIIGLFDLLGAFNGLKVCG